LEVTSLVLKTVTELMFIMSPVERVRLGIDTLPATVRSPSIVTFPLIVIDFVIVAPPDTVSAVSSVVESTLTFPSVSMVIPVPAELCRVVGPPLFRSFNTEPLVKDKTDEETLFCNVTLEAADVPVDAFFTTTPTVEFVDEFTVIAAAVTLFVTATPPRTLSEGEESVESPEPSVDSVPVELSIVTQLCPPIVWNMSLPDPEPSVTMSHPRLVIKFRMDSVTAPVEVLFIKETVRVESVRAVLSVHDDVFEHTVSPADLVPTAPDGSIITPPEFHIFPPTEIPPDNTTLPVETVSASDVLMLTICPNTATFPPTSIDF
jgi:hypothetical protein